MFKFLFWKNLSYSGLRRMFAGFFILLFIGVNTGNILLYTFFSRTLVKEMGESNQDMLTKVKNATELICGDMLSLSVRLGNWNTTITRMMFEKDRDRLLEYQGTQIMRDTLLSYPNIDYIAVYNERLDEIMGTRYFTSQTAEDMKELANAYFRRGGLNLTIPLNVASVSAPAADAGRKTITMIIYSHLSLAEEKGVLLAGINCGYFQQLIRRMDERNLGTVMILHGGGQIISHPDPDQLLLNFRDQEIYELLNTDNSQSGYFVRGSGRNKTHITYTQSGVLGWTFISMTPWDKMAAKLIALRNLTLAITAVILFTGLFISYLLALKMYRPVQRILKRLDYRPALQETGRLKNEDEYIEKQIDYLRSAADISEPLIRSAIVMDLLKNQYTGNSPIVSRVCAEAFQEAYYLVCLLSWDGREDFERLSAGEQGLRREQLIKIALEFLGRTCVSADHAVIDPVTVALVLHLESGAIPGSLFPLLAETAEAAEKFCGQTVSAARGSIVNSIFAINDSFEEARELLKERFFSGPQTIMSADLARPRREDNSFPDRIVEELYQAILRGDTKKMRTLTGEFAAFLGEVTCEYARMCLSMLVMRLLSFCLFNKLPVDAGSFHHLNSRILTSETLREAMALLADFCLSLSGDPADSPPPLIQEAIALAAENYQNPGFSINAAAESFNITPAYFNRIFKKHKHISYSEFLNEYRMEKARVLLLESNVSILDIAGMAGFGNTNYFYTLFKKIYRCTPQQYRRRRQA
jgi:AraC-like DNA-binding protein